MSKKVKKISDWLKEIPDEVPRARAIFIHSHSPLLKKSPSLSVDSAFKALALAFDWTKTPEGFIYWDHVYTKIKEENALSSRNDSEIKTENRSGMECIQITEHMNFCLGNAVKYIWRADKKDNAIQDLQQAAWYVNREIERRLKAPE
jgi:hypothetical protein